MAKGVQPRKDIEWITPRQTEPGQVIAVHALWTPHPEQDQKWMGPPDSPADEILGYWAPIPRQQIAVEDFHYAHCCVITSGVVNLFQEDPEFCVIQTLGQEWRFPWDGEFMIATMTDKLQDAINIATALPQP